MRNPWRQWQLSRFHNRSAFVAIDRCISEGEHIPICFSSLGLLTDDATDTLHDGVNHLLANSVVTTGVVVGGILLTADKKLGVEKLTVGAGSDLVNGRGVKINEQSTGNVLSAAGLGEEGLVRAGVASILNAGIGTTIGAEAVLEKVAVIFVVVSIQDGVSAPDDRPKTCFFRGEESTYSSQAELPSWVPAWPI